MRQVSALLRGPGDARITAVPRNVLARGTTVYLDRVQTAARTSEPDAELRAAVRARAVWAEASPAREAAPCGFVIAAHLVRLWAVHRRGEAVLPGAPVSRRAYADLLAIAARALADAALAGVCVELLPFDARLYASALDGHDEVELTVRLHPATFPAAAGPTEQRAAERLVRALAALGVRSGPPRA